MLDMVDTCVLETDDLNDMVLIISLIDWSV